MNRLFTIFIVIVVFVFATPAFAGGHWVCGPNDYFGGTCNVRSVYHEGDQATCPICHPNQQVQSHFSQVSLPNDGAPNLVVTSAGFDTIVAPRQDWFVNQYQYTGLPQYPGASDAGIQGRQAELTPEFLEQAFVQEFSSKAHVFDSSAGNPIWNSNTWGVELKATHSKAASPLSFGNSKGRAVAKLLTTIFGVTAIAVGAHNDNPWIAGGGAAAIVIGGKVLSREELKRATWFQYEVVAQFRSSTGEVKQFQAKTLPVAVFQNRTVLAFNGVSSEPVWNSWADAFADPMREISTQFEKWSLESSSPARALLAELEDENKRLQYEESLLKQMEEAMRENNRLHTKFGLPLKDISPPGNQ